MNTQKIYIISVGQKIWKSYTIKEYAIEEEKRIRKRDIEHFLDEEDEETDEQLQGKVVYKNGEVLVIQQLFY